MYLNCRAVELLHFAYQRPPEFILGVGGCYCVLVVLLRNVHLATLFKLGLRADMTIRIWDVPSDPPPGHELKDPVAILTGSAKKVIATEWNPVADFILASGCFDGAVALW